MEQEAFSPISSPPGDLLLDPEEAPEVSIHSFPHPWGCGSCPGKRENCLYIPFLPFAKCPTGLGPDEASNSQGEKSLGL